MSDAFSQPCYCLDPERLRAIVAETLNRYALLSGVRRLGLAVSGGADSVALFDLMLPLCAAQGITPVVLHLNHGLRGAASDEDEHFVRTLAQSAVCPVHTEHVRLAARPPDNQSLEMAAREARLAFFRQSIHDADLDAIATGHQADDVAETLFLRLARGAGASGLAGLRPCSRLPQSNTPLIRPLLAVAGQTLRCWLQQQGRVWREDDSNLDPAMERNRLRHQILPDLEACGLTALRAQLCRSAAILREEDALLDHLAAEALDSLSVASTPDTLPATPLLHHPEALQRRILRQWLFSLEYADSAGFARVTEILTCCRAGNPARLQLSGNRMIQYLDGHLTLRTCPEAVEPPPEMHLPRGGACRWGALAFTTAFTRGVESQALGIGHYPACCTVSLEALGSHPLLIRTRQPGDRMTPTGLHGTKKIQDIFTDEKIPVGQRDTIPLLVCNEEIVWIPGYRIAERFAVPAPDTPSLRLSVTHIS